MTTRYFPAGFLASVSATALLLGSGGAALAQSTSIEAVTITGTRTAASEVEKQAPNILDIAPLEQIRSLPDANAAEALQRLPGVSMESDSGEGRFINIRGMDADLNGTTYDGVRMMASNPASPQGGGRAVAFDSFPAGILGGIEVMKSLTPDMDAEGLGGVVNILPRTIPTGQDQFLDASVGSGIESLRGSPVYKGDITAGKRFFDDKVAVILSYGYEQDHRGINDIEADYINDPTTVPAGTSAFLTQKAFDDLQFRRYQYHRLRQGFGGSITYSPDSNSNLYLRAMHAGYVEWANKHEFVLSSLADNIQSVNNTTGDFTSLGAASHYADINTRESVGNDLLELGGNTLIGDTVKVDGRLSWTQGYDHFPYGITAKFSNPTPFDVVYNNTNPNLPTYSVVGGANLVNPALYSTLSGTNSPSNTNDTEFAQALNFSMPLNLVGENGVFKFGGNLRERSRKAQQYGANLVPVSQNLTDYVGGPDDIYYGGHYDLGPQPDYRKLLTIPNSQITADPTTFEHDNENVYAGYAQYSTSFGALDVIAGVRIESTDGTYRANTETTDTLGNTTITPGTATHSYTNVFPDVSLKYQASDNLQLRAAFTTAIARPGFNQISAARSINLNNATPIVSQGNPDLSPTLGRNVDLTAVYDLPDNGEVSIGLFYKAFSDYVISTEQLNATNVPGFIGQNVDLVSYSNIGAAHAEGVELSYNQQFSFLPGPFSGLGFDGNMTYVESRGEIRAGEEHTLPQTSPFNYNAGIFYESGPVYLKLAAAFVSSNLWVVGGSSSTDLYSQSRFRLDFGSTYDINDQVQAYFDIKNISSTHLEFTQTNNRNFPVQNEYYGQDYLFGVRVRL
jgi:TonB-dependent receptor